MDITNEDIITRTEERKSRNRDDENKNGKRQACDDNKSAIK